MCKPRIGELLSKIACLSPMDVEEILQDQTVTHRRFGEIALSWGLCGPEDIWHAWYNQLAGHAPTIDLEELGVDAQAVNYISRDMAIQFNMIPVRVFEDLLVIAVGHDIDESLMAKIILQLPKDVRFVRADENQIRAAIETYYEPALLSA